MAFRRCLLNGAFVWFSLTHSLLTGGSVSVLDTSKYHYMVNWMGLGQVLTPSRSIDRPVSYSRTPLSPSSAAMFSGHPLRPSSVIRRLALALAMLGAARVGSSERLPPRVCRRLEGEQRARSP